MVGDAPKDALAIQSRVNNCGMGTDVGCRPSTIQTHKKFSNSHQHTDDQMFAGHARAVAGTLRACATSPGNGRDGLNVLSTGCGRIQQPELWPACAVHTQASARGLTAVPQPPSVAMHHNFSQRTLTCQTSASKQSRRLPCLFSSLPSANWCNSTRHSPAPRCNASSAQRYQIPSDRQLWCGHPQRTGISGTPRATRPEALSQVLP